MGRVKPGQGKPKLPRGKVPPAARAHRDEKKEAGRAACRRFRKSGREQ